MWHSRIVDTGTADPADLLANPDNWRIHPRYQREAVRDMLAEVGWVEEIIVNRTTGHVVDGHLRILVALDEREVSVPVSYVELTEAEEATVLASLDTSGTSEIDPERTDRLLAVVSVQSERLDDTLQRIADRRDRLKDFKPARGKGDPIRKVVFGQYRALLSEEAYQRWWNALYGDVGESAGDIHRELRRRLNLGEPDGA